MKLNLIFILVMAFLSLPIKAHASLSEESATKDHIGILPVKKTLESSSQDLCFKIFEVEAPYRGDYYIESTF